MEMLVDKLKQETALSCILSFQLNSKCVGKGHTATVRMRRVGVIVITVFATKDPLKAGSPYCVLSNLRDRLSFLLQGCLHRYLFAQQHLAWAAESSSFGKGSDCGPCWDYTQKHKDVSPRQSLTSGGKMLPSVNILCVLWLKFVAQLQRKLLELDVRSEEEWIPQNPEATISCCCCCLTIHDHPVPCHLLHCSCIRMYFTLFPSQGFCSIMPSIFFILVTQVLISLLTLWL